MPNLKNSLGIDFGVRWVGLSHSLESNNYIVSDYKTLDNIEVIDKILEILVDLNIELIVIGYPLDMYGKHTRITGLVDDFILLLNGKTNIKIIPQDEFGSSEAAIKLIKIAKLDPGLVHQISAKIILGDYIHSLV
jgi:putative transcription antitermination factor YqgF